MSTVGQLAQIALWVVKTWGNPVEKAGAKAVASGIVFWQNPSPATQKAWLIDLQTAIAVDVVSTPPIPPPTLQPPDVILTPGGHEIPTSGGAG